MQLRKRSVGRMAKRPSKKACGPVEEADEHIDEAALREELLRWIKKNGVKSTTNTYATYLKQFRSFCAVGGLSAFPASPATVAAFLRYLSEGRGLKANTTSVASAAIASEYKLTGLTAPTRETLVKARRLLLRETASQRSQNSRSTRICCAECSLRQEQTAGRINATTPS